MMMILNEKEDQLSVEHSPSGLRVERMNILPGATEPIQDVSALRASEEVFAFRVSEVRSRKNRMRCDDYLERLYRKNGLAGEKERSFARSRMSLEEDRTYTLLAEDNNGRIVGTVSLSFPVNGMLPCDEIFGPEMRVLRTGNQNICEVTALGLDGSFEYSRTVLTRLFNLIYIYARLTRGFDDFVIEVHPRHIEYYRRLFSFEQCGDVRPCPRVKDAPALLMCLDLAATEVRVKVAQGCIVDKSVREPRRSLYPYFLAHPDEQGVLRTMVSDQPLVLICK